MSARHEEVANYGNWVSFRIILAPAVLALLFVASSLLTFWLLVPAAICLVIALYFVYARYLFSPKGGNVQEKVRNLILENLDWDGKGTALDIGCGSASLAIGIAQKFPCSTVVGTDYWGGNWEYSKKVCEENALLQKVEDRVSFQQASASSLPFRDEQFDAVVSNLVFHEVKDTPNKVDLIKEALRVLKNGGRFTLQDLFYIHRMYGTPEELCNAVKSWGVQKVQFVSTKSSSFIPAALQLPFMVGTLGLIKGKK
jgi:SAM-dependent methyltransferase